METVQQVNLRAVVANELAELVAADAPREDLLVALEKALGCRLRVILSDEGINHEVMGCPIAPGTEILGRLESDVPAALAVPEFVGCLEYGARVIGIELVRERAALEARWVFEGDLLVELADARDAIPERLIQRANRAGFDLRLRWRVLLVEIDGGRISATSFAQARKASIPHGHAMSCMLGHRLAVAVCETPNEARDSEIHDIHSTARRLGLAVRVGVSSTISDFACGIRQAEAALRLADCGRQTSTVYHEDLGSLRWVLNAPDQTELKSLVQTHIGPLAKHDREHRSDLVETLRVFLDEGGNRRRAAERCYIHLSTMKYRLGRIRELLGCDLGDANVRFDLMLALKVVKLLSNVGAEPTPRRVL